MAIRFHSEHPTFRLRKVKEHRSWIKEVLAFHGKIPGELDFIFTTNDYLLEINIRFLNHNYFTDVITFDYSEGNMISGEIYISRDQVESNAGIYGTGVWEEMNRVMIHGILHLAGFRDESEEEKEEMRLRENEALRLWPEGER